MHLRGAAQSGWRSFGKSKETNLALLNQRGHCSRSLFDGNARVHAMLIIEIDLLYAEPPETSFAGLLDVFRTPIHAQKLAVG